MNLLSDFLKSVYVVFEPHIKGEIVDFLVKQKAINIHVGVSPTTEELIVTFGRYMQ